MARSFGIVEEKLREAEFFLQRLRESDRHSSDGRFYFSAFVSAARSVTFSLQATMRGVPGFDSWYQGVPAKLRGDLLAPIFREIRNESIHEGLNPLNQTTIYHLREDLFRQMYDENHSHIILLPDPKIKGHTILHDAVDVSESYLRCIVEIIFDCYQFFKCVVDPRWYFTHDNFSAMGKTLKDALTELGFPSDWLSCAPDYPEETNAWRVLRLREPPCLINDLFWKYLEREIPDPDDSVVGPVDT